MTGNANLNWTDTRKELRQFGLLMGSVLPGLFGLLFPWIFSKAFPSWPWYTGGFFLATAVLLPRALAPIHRFWMAFAHVLGYVNSRILLGLVFFLVLAPMGIVRRFLGKDALERRFDKKRLTYRMMRGYDKDQNHMGRPF